MIRNLIFDMGNVIVFWTPDSIMDDMHIVDPQERALLKRDVFGSKEWPLLDWGKFTGPEAEKLFCSRTPKEYWPHIHHALDWFDIIRPVPGMVDYLKQKKAEGYRLFLLSNAPDYVYDHAYQIPGLQYMDGIIISGREKLLKPMPEIYQLVLNRYNLKADESLFIDDLALNCAGALMQGMDSLIFHGNPQEIEDYLCQKAINK